MNQQGEATGPLAILFERGYKPFFIGAALLAPLSILLWAGALSSGWGLSDYLGTRGYHVHEMVFGYLGAVLAGYLLSEVPNWTGRRTITGTSLAVLFALWLAGRIAMVAPTPIPVLSAAIDAAFLIVMAAIAWREALRRDDLQHVTICLTVSVIALANVAFHGERILMGGTPWTERVGLGLAALWVAFSGGEIASSATWKWMSERGLTPLPMPLSYFDVTSLCLAVVTIIAWVLWPDDFLTGLLFLATALLHLVRLGRWQGWRTGGAPILMVLHLGYLWLVVWFALTAVSILAPERIDGSTALHALAAGAIATMTIAVMSRAFLEHRGLPLSAGPFMLAAFALLNAGALVRLAAAMASIDHYIAMISAAALLWACGYLLFVLRFAPFCWRHSH